MSLRTFTVFQDSPSNEQQPAKVMRPNAMATRPQTRNKVSSTPVSSATDLDKENYDPVTGERAGLAGSTAGKKRKTGALATKSHSSTDRPPQPEKKKRKPSPQSSQSAENKLSKKSLKSSVTTRKGKRTGSRKVSPMPKLPEEDEATKVNTPATQPEIDSRCKELTLKPLADVSEAYDEISAFCPSASAGAGASQAKPEIRTVKAPSVEPEIRDYFEPSETLFASTSTSARLNALSEDSSEVHTFSTPERKRIYAAFTFSSPAGPTLLVSESSRNDDNSSSSTSDLA